MDKLVSVIVPAYNQANFLPFALDAVLAQTYSHWECIIVNDGSPDNSGEIALRYCANDPRFKYVKKENGGLSSARNAGLKIATGEWVQFLDSDDYIDPEKLQLSMNLVAKNPDSSLIVSDFKMFKDHPRNAVAAFCDLNQERLNFESILLKWDAEFNIPIHSGFFKADVFSDPPFVETLKNAEDWVMWLSIFQKNLNAMYLDKPLAYYRINPNSTTRDRTFARKSLTETYKYVIPLLPPLYAYKFIGQIFDRLNDTIFCYEKDLKLLRAKPAYKIEKRRKGYGEENINPEKKTLISLIICSRTASLPTKLEDNIKDTIGVDYEAVLINNEQNKYSIFEAYNLGVARSKYPILCFMHDDISYDTKDWGKKVIAHFEDATTGAIGIAGTPYAPAMPGSWWGGGLVNISLLKNEPRGELNLQKYPPTAANRNEVILLDGVWICVRRSLFDTIRFDDVSYKGFHFYDVDTCMQIATAGFKIYSVFDVLLYHDTKGNNMNHSWNENALIFNKKWKVALPLSCIKLSYAEKCEAELKTLKEYIYSLIYNGHSNKEVHKIAILQVLRFYKGYGYYKTPVQLLKYVVKYFLKPKGTT